MPSPAVRPTMLQVQRAILKFLAQRSAPVRPSELFTTPTLQSLSTANERRVAVWDLIDRRLVEFAEDRTLSLRRSSARTIPLR